MPRGNLVAVTVVGDDRPGIVAAVTKVLFEAGSNLEDISSTILRGHFSMMLIVRVPENTQATELEERMNTAAEDFGLVITVRKVPDAPLHIGHPTHMVSVYGADRPGIVFRVAETLAAQQANITDLTSRVIGPEDAPVYALMMEVITPDETQLKQALRSVSDELKVDVTVRPLEVDVL